MIEPLLYRMRPNMPQCLNVNLRRKTMANHENLLLEFMNSPIENQHKRFMIRKDCIKMYIYGHLCHFDDKVLKRRLDSKITELHEKLNVTDLPVSPVSTPETDGQTDTSDSSSSDSIPESPFLIVRTFSEDEDSSPVVSPSPNEDDVESLGAGPSSSSQLLKIDLINEDVSRSTLKRKLEDLRPKKRATPADMKFPQRKIDKLTGPGKKYPNYARKIRKYFNLLEEKQIPVDIVYPFYLDIILHLDLMYEDSVIEAFGLQKRVKTVQF